MGRGTTGRCIVFMGSEVEIRSMVAHDKTNGQWERQGLMGYDELRDMGRLVLMKKEA
jgi:hypothetical protein